MISKKFVGVHLKEIYLGHVKLDGVPDELRMFLDNLLDFLFLNVFVLVFFEEKFNFSSSANGWTIVEFDSERTASGRLPDVLFIVIVLKLFLIFIFIIDLIKIFRDTMMAVSDSLFDLQFYNSDKFSEIFLQAFKPSKRKVT